MQVIYKYELAITYRQTLQIPKGATIVHAQMQEDSLCIWAMVTLCTPTAPRSFILIGTGMAVPEEHEYVATVQQGMYIWHICQKEETDDT